MLTVRGLQAGYAHGDVLRGVSLEVRERELVALLGANGAGKTTLLRAMSGMLAPGGGCVTFAGEDITANPAHEICTRGLVHVPEGRHVFPRMTVLENLLLGAIAGDPWRRREETLTEVIERFPILAERRGQLAGTLSGGEQQQLAIARGLMARPRLLLLDEPTLGLAPVLARTILDAIGGLRDDGLTVLLVSQEAVGALSVADRAYVLEMGAVALSGDAGELMHDDAVRAAYLGLETTVNTKGTV